MPGRVLSDQEYRDVHDTIMVLLAVAGDCKVNFKPQIGEVFQRAHLAIKTENDPPFAVLPYHKGQKRIAMPQGARAMLQDQYLKATSPQEAALSGNGDAARA